MNISSKIFRPLLLAVVAACATAALNSCSKDKADPIPQPEPQTEASYVISICVEGTTNGTAYYVLDAGDLMSGTISAVNQGIEHVNYMDYFHFGNTLLGFEGVSSTIIKGIKRDANGDLKEEGSYVFDNMISESVQIDDNTVVSVEFPRSATRGDMVKVYSLNLTTLVPTVLGTIPVASFITVSDGDDTVWPITTGMAFSEGKLYISYYEQNTTKNNTPWVENGQIAVLSYPAAAIERIIKDDRTGPIGSWNKRNGIFEVENGDLYLMSNSSLINGFTQSVKPATFTRIRKGGTDFDNTYLFDFSAATGGLRPSHIQYLENGLVFARVSPLTQFTEADRWSDKPMKGYIIDIYNKTAVEVAGLPEHAGPGGRHFMAMYDNGYVYLPVATGSGVYIYRVDPQTATAEQGAKVSCSFVANICRIDK